MSRFTGQILVAYFSHSGNTRKIANLIHQAVGGTLYEIQPENPYPRAYNAVVEQAKGEIRAGFHPELHPSLDQISSYDLIFVGSPNWWSTLAPPVASFLSAYDFSEKTILPFCTHGGGGMGRIEQAVRELCPQSTILSSLKIYGSGGLQAKTEVSAWLQRVGIHG